VAVVLAIAYIGNNWKDSYPRNDNHNIPLFWFMNVALLVAGALTLQHKPGREGSVQLLSRSQTEEWKGWMQWAFIMVRVEL
jgi:N-acetylneuraminate 9-O-acetyltransferase